MANHMANTRKRHKDKGLVRVEISAFPSGQVDKLRKVAMTMKSQAAERADLFEMVTDAFAHFRARCLDNVSPPPDSIRLVSLRRVAAMVAEALVSTGGREGFMLGQRIRHRIKSVEC